MYWRLRDYDGTSLVCFKVTVGIYSSLDDASDSDTLIGTDQDIDPDEFITPYE